MSPTEHWERIEGTLREAFESLPEDVRRRPVGPVPPGPVRGTLDEYHEFISNNEFELAWESLAGVAKRHKAPAATWLLLARAARQLKKPARVKESMREIERSLAREDRPHYRLVLQRLHRTPQGRLVWRRAAGHENVRAAS